MQLTQEVRTALLTGNFGDARAWPDVSMAPVHIQNRIVEVRYAIASDTAVPAPSREYVREAEQRSLASRTSAQRLFKSLRKGQSLQDLYLEQTGREYRPTVVQKPIAAKPTVRTEGKQTLEQLSKRYGHSVESLQDAELRLRATRMGEEIATYNLPTGPMNADEKEQMKRRLDVAMGLREPEAWPSWLTQ